MVIPDPRSDEICSVVLPPVTDRTALMRLPADSCTLAQAARCAAERVLGN
jgi:hypothetical protein